MTRERELLHIALLKLQRWCPVEANITINTIRDLLAEPPLPIEAVERWIPVNERLPNKAGVYIGWWADKGAADTLGFNGGWEWGDGSKMRNSSQITHWMPLPAAPSVSEESK